MTVHKRLNVIQAEGHQEIPTRTYPAPFQYGAQVYREADYVIHQYIDQQKASCFMHPYQTPYPPIDIDLKYFKILCDDFDDINKGDIHGQSVLHALCLYGSINAIKILLEAGAEISREDLAGFSAAHYCAISDRGDILSYLHKSGINVTKEAWCSRRTPLHVASMCKSISCVKYLLSVEGNIVNQVDKYGYSPLWLAMYYRNSDICVLLTAKGAQIHVTQVDKISFGFRTLGKCHEYGKELLNSYITRCEYREVCCIWLNKLTNGVSYQSSDLTHAYLYVTSLNKQFIEHPVIKAYTSVAWKSFGRKQAYIDLARNLLFCLLWTLHFMSDNGKTFRNAENILKIVVYVFLLPYTCYMFYHMISLLICRMRKRDAYIKYELGILCKELDILHPCMWNANNVLLREKRIIFDTCTRNGTTFLSVLGRQFTEIMILTMSAIILILDLMMPFFGSDESRKPHLGRLYMIISSVVLVSVWTAGFNTFRHFKEFQLFMVSIREIANLLVKYSCMFIVFYVPIACVFWKTIYEPTNRRNMTSNNTAGVKPIDAFYQVYRMTYSDYTYSDGLDIASTLGIPDWWNILTFYWITLGGLILIRIFGAMVFSVMSRPMSDAQYMASNDRLKYICDIIMRQSNVKRQQFANHLALDCNPYVTEKYFGEENSVEDLILKMTKLQSQLDRVSATISFNSEQSRSLIIN